MSWPTIGAVALKVGTGAAPQPVPMMTFCAVFVHMHWAGARSLTTVPNKTNAKTAKARGTRMTICLLVLGDRTSWYGGIQRRRSNPKDSGFGHRNRVSADHRLVPKKPSTGRRDYSRVL